MATLEQVLLNTLNKDKAVRDAAERALNEACGHPDYVVSLLRVACEANNPKEVRQAASVALKNGIKRNWTTPEEEESLLRRPIEEQQKHHQLAGKYTIPQESRNIVRANILQGLSMVRSDNESLRRVLAECVGLLSEIDYPDRWPSLVSEIVSMLSNINDRDCVHNGLLALRRVVKRFQYKRRPRKSKMEAKRKMKGGAVVVEKNKREPLDRLVEATFPILLQYAQKFVTMDDDQAGFLLRMIGKIFHSATQLELPPHLWNPNVIGEWFKLWEVTISKPLSPQQSLGDDLDDLSIRPWWKCKKCALEIAVGFFNQVTKDPLFVSDDDAINKQFSTYFIEGGVAASFLQATTKMLEEWANNIRPLPSIIIQLCLSYLTSALEPSKTYKLLKPHLQFIVDQVVLKCMSFTERDQQEWDDDPQACAAQGLAPLEDVFDVKATAAHFLLEACKLRSRDTLDGVVNHLFQEMRMRSSPGKQDACLFAVGAMAEILAPYIVRDHNGEVIEKKTTKRVEKYKDHLESMISVLVVPELNAPEPFIRARACWVVGRYAHVSWKDSQIVTRTFGGLLDRLGDAHLPVQSQAASSLRAVLVLDPETSLAAKTLREVAVHHLPVIIEKYLLIMSRVGADDVVAGLRALIDAFNTEIAPMASEICRALVQAYFHYANASDEDEDDDGKKAFAAFETLDAINSLMDCAANTPNKSIISAMEPVVMPLFEQVINPDADVVDTMEPVVKTYSFLTYYCPLPFSDNVWAMVGRIRACFDTIAFDLLQDFSIPLEHLAFRDPLRFYQGSDQFLPPGTVSYAQCCFDMCKRVLEDTTGEQGAGELDLRYAATLLCAILQAAPSEQHALPFLEQSCKQASYWLFIQNSIDLSRSTRAKLFEIVESCFFISPVNTRRVFAQSLMLGLQKLRDVLPSHFRIRKKKIAVLGLSSLVSVLPQTDGNDVSLMSLTLAECAELLENIKQQREFGQADDDEEDGEDEEEEEEFEVGDEEDEAEEEEEEADEDEDAEDDEEANYKEFLAANGDFGGAWGELDGEDEDDAESEPDDYPWPQDKIDENQYFAQAIKVAAQANPQLVKMALTSMDESVRSVILEKVPELVQL